MNNDANLARLLQAFFTDRLMQQRQASPHTIVSYRDTFCLLLRFIQRVPEAITDEAMLGLNPAR